MYLAQYKDYLLQHDHMQPLYLVNLCTYITKRHSYFFKKISKYLYIYMQFTTQNNQLLFTIMKESMVSYDLIIDIVVPGVTGKSALVPYGTIVLYDTPALIKEYDDMFGDLKRYTKGKPTVFLMLNETRFEKENT